MISSEAAPFAKTGGLADVVGSLPSALRSFGDEVAVVIPRYASIDLKNARRVWDNLPVHFGPRFLSRLHLPGAGRVSRVPGGLPAALRPQRLLRRIRPGLSGQPHSFCRVLPRRARRRPRPVSHRHLSLPRLADRTRARLPAHHFRHRPDLPRLPDPVHDPQPRIPGTVPEERPWRRWPWTPPSTVRTAWSFSAASATSRPASNSPTR